ncbi:MAG: transposase [Candidatus Acidiferrales bacterium]
MAGSNPGNANVAIGGGKNAIRENGAPRNDRPAIRENGAPRGSQPANQEIGVPRNFPRVWHSRGYLPHFEGAEVVQHVTFHLADSLPQTVLRRLEAELKILPAEKRDAERRKRLDAWIDAGHGSCVLGNPGIASMAQESLLAFDSQRYRLLEWVVMPNHVHVLFQPVNGWTVAKIVASWKMFTARKICDELRSANREIGVPRNNQPANREIGVPRDVPGGGPVWHREYWDRYIRDQRHFDKAVEYIRQNPVKAGLVARAEDWRWSSAYEGANREIDVPRNSQPANQEIGVPRHE